MTIFKKIADVQMELQKVEFTKSGHNKFGNFKYFELDDIMPCIQSKCYDHDLMMQFLFNDKKATLMIVDVTNGERFCNEIPMPAVIELNKKMNVVQSLGAYITYLKRYLLLNTFCICEKSVIDSDAMSSINNKKHAAPKVETKGNHIPRRQGAAPERKVFDDHGFMTAADYKKSRNENQKDDVMVI